ncbi:hypothetical protein PsorP6_011521 [Peronosclerospora sorghi]|uniref:Uncharacterized protein n=1 Tax=Peronosclerospora sorghi TaxID=230839 RepID=A0ACC0WIV0_9STRA|nr:hypothetical protein PsorP6_011521 [Peronosclerospora sorghi]
MSLPFQVTTDASYLILYLTTRPVVADALSRTRVVVTNVEAAYFKDKDFAIIECLRRGDDRLSVKYERRNDLLYVKNDGESKSFQLFSYNRPIVKCLRREHL